MADQYGFSYEVPSPQTEREMFAKWEREEAERKEAKRKEAQNCRLLGSVRNLERSLQKTRCPVKRCTNVITKRHKKMMESIRGCVPCSKFCGM